MYSFKNSLAALAGLLVLVAVFAALTPLVSQGQGGNPLTRRSFYLTQTEHNGSQALSACASGYHMASLWEIFDTSNLKYNTQLGFTREDSGFGPPANSFGWIRTGGPPDNGSLPPGVGNCDAWTNASGTASGTDVALDNFWSDAARAISPWIAFTSTCDSSRRVWCVQD